MRTSIYSHCKAIAPKLAQYNEDFEDITFIKVDIDDLPVSGIPPLLPPSLQGRVPRKE